MVMMRLLATLALAFACGCAPPRGAVSNATLLAADGTAHTVRDLAREAPFTAIVFFSAHCSCQEAHDARLRALIDRFAGRVRFLLVDSEVGATAEREASEAARRGYATPPMIDRGGELARALGAEWATYTVVVDREGRVEYAGGIDSDRVHLTPDTMPYLANALEDLLGGRAPRVRTSKALGCALRTS
jgi:hypothetical protein